LAALICLASVSMLAPARARAQPLGEQPRPCVARTDQGEVGASVLSLPALVDLTLAGNGQVPALAAVIRQLLGRLEVTVCATRAGDVDPVDVVLPPAHPPPALARIWIAPTREGATVYVVDSKWNRILVRHVPLPGGLEVAAREELAQIVYSTVEALKAGAEIGVVKPAEAEPAPVIAPPRPRVTTEAQVRYTGRLAGRGSPIDHEVALAAAFASRKRASAPVIGVALGYRFPDTETTETVGIRSSGALLRLEAGFELALGNGTSLRPGVGLGLELEFVDSRTVSGSGVVPEPSQVALWPLASASVGVFHRLSGSLSVAAALSADVDILGERYAVEDSTGDTIVAKPWAVRPGIWIGMVSEL